MAIVISTLALLITMMLLIVHYKNQIERRHGEITKLRSDFLWRLAAAHQRLISVQLHLEAARIELRHLTDCDAKYEMIEDMPKLIENVREAVQGINEVNKELEDMDTKKLNKTKTLLMLQAIENRVRSIEAKASPLEQKTLLFLESFRTSQEQEEKQD